MRRRSWFAGIGVVVLATASLAAGVGPAAAAPSNCTLWFTPTGANPNFTGAAALCTRGSGTYNVTIRCDVPHFPDYSKTSRSVSVGTTTSVTCNYGNHVARAELNKSS
jgi:hypothetical protein